MIQNGKIRDEFFWFNEPEHAIEGETLVMTTSPDTDFWQRTHYGFRRDNGHCLLVQSSGDFSMTVRTDFDYRKQYDQCGLIVRCDAETWIKTSIEFETSSHVRLGSVVTNDGWSDWATIDLDRNPGRMWYRIQSRGSDYLMEYGPDGRNWTQLRIAHLHTREKPVFVGVYACSPMDSWFTAWFADFELTESGWKV